MQSSRLLSILMLLQQSHGGLSAQALAAELAVSVRTIYRDVDRLSAAGVPIWAETGRNGGLRLREGWRTKLDGLTVPEAQAVFMAGLPGPAAELGLGEALASAQLKLMAALPADWQEDARRVGTRFHLDPLDWYRESPGARHLGLVAQSVWRERRLWLRYESWKGMVERELEPLGLVLKAGAWYLVARTGAGQAPRSYALHSMLELRALEQGFSRPRDFDLASFWRASIASFEAQLQRSSAELRVSALGLKQLKGLSRALAEAAAAAQPDAQRPDWLHLTIPIESVEHAAGQLLRLGPEAEALAPPALRRRLGELVLQMQALYA